MKYKTYGKMESFKSEGDMYKAVTGRRSKVIDSYEKKSKRKTKEKKCDLCEGGFIYSYLEDGRLATWSCPKCDNGVIYD